MITEEPTWEWEEWKVLRNECERQADGKYMAQQDIHSPGEKEEADLGGDLIQSYPQILIVYAI